MDTQRLRNQPLYPARIDASDSIGAKARFALIGSPVPPELCSGTPAGGTLGTTDYTPDGMAYLPASTATTWAQKVDDLDPYISGSFTVFWRGVLRSNTAQTLLQYKGASYGWKVITGAWAPDYLSIYLVTTWSGAGSNKVIAISDNTLHSLAVRHDDSAATVEFFLDGVSLGSGSFTKDPGAVGAGTFSMLGDAALPHKMLTVQAFKGVLTNEEIGILAANSWHVLEPENDEIDLVISGGAAALAGDAWSAAAATGALTTEITLSTTAQSQAAASGTLSTQISLAASAVSIATAGGGLTAQIQLSGAALAQAISTAALSGGMNLSASAVADAAASGMLDTIIRLIGSAAANASANGSLSTGTSGSLEGNAQAAAAAGASLTAQIRLDADALAQAGASAGLSSGIRLGAHAQGGASSAGAITTSIQLSAVTISQAIAAGTLVAQIELSTAAIARAFADGTLDTRIDLSGGASASASASGNLSVGALYSAARLVTGHKLIGARLHASAQPVMRLTTEVRHV